MAYVSPAENAARQTGSQQGVASWQAATGVKPTEKTSKVVSSNTAAKTLTMVEAARTLKEAGVPYGGQAGSQLKDWESISNYLGANVVSGAGSLKGTASPNSVASGGAEVSTAGGGGGGGGSSSKSTTYAMADEPRMSGLEMDTYRNFYGKMKSGRTPQAAQLLSPYRGYGGPRSTAIGNPNVQTATKMLLGS